jgi:antitoxin (DNA-binding transcriptional repressor) of toxin-antitoxin stability system
MQKQVNIHDAKTNLSKLVEEVEGGGDGGSCAGREPVARIVPLEVKRVVRFGLMKGKIEIGADFDAPLPFSFEVGA